jgi:hypothetical protein
VGVRNYGSLMYLRVLTCPASLSTSIKFTSSKFKLEDKRNGEWDQFVSKSKIVTYLHKCTYHRRNHSIGSHVSPTKINFNLTRGADHMFLVLHIQKTQNECSMNLMRGHQV